MIVQDLSHQRAWDLIPLAINRTAPAHELAFVEAHLRECADCRDEYAFQLRMHAGMQAADAAGLDVAAPALRRLFDRIDEEDRVAPHGPLAAGTPRRAWSRRPRSRQVRLLGAAVVAQAFALALLGASLLDRASTPVPVGEGRYETLSATNRPGIATIRLVPAPTLSLAGLHELLAENGLRVVEVNVDGTIYSLAPLPESAAANPADTLSRLRARPDVLFAEPVGGRGE
jgi:hypothetical protein